MAQPRPPVVLVTGCAEGGLGYAMCQEFAQRGCIVYAAGPNIQEFSSLAAPANDRIRLLTLDITKPQNVERVVGQVLADVGYISVLVNNAGLFLTSPAVDCDMQKVKKLFEVNFFGLMSMSQAVARVMMRQRHGTIVNLGSMASRAHVPFMAAYSATKSAVESLSTTMRLELAPFNVKVLYVSPVWIKTKLMANAGYPSREEWQQGSYAPLYDVMYNHFNSPRAWCADRVARMVASAALRRRPPYALYCGTDWWLWWFLTLLPRVVLDCILYIKAKLYLLAKGPGPSGLTAGQAGAA